MAADCDAAHTPRFLAQYKFCSGTFCHFGRRWCMQTSRLSTRLRVIWAPPNEKSFALSPFAPERNRQVSFGWCVYFFNAGHSFSSGRGFRNGRFGNLSVKNNWAGERHAQQQQLDRRAVTYILNNNYCFL